MASLSTYLGLIPVLVKSGHSVEIVSGIHQIGSIITPILTDKSVFTDKARMWNLLETMAKDGRLKTLFDLSAQIIEDLLPLMSDPKSAAAIMNFLESLS